MATFLPVVDDTNASVHVPITAGDKIGFPVGAVIPLGSGAPTGATAVAPPYYIDTATTPHTMYHYDGAAWQMIGDGNTVAIDRSFETKAALQAVPAGLVNVAQVLLPDAAADGGITGVWQKRASAPSPVKPWHLQTVAGEWFELKNSRVSPRMFGAVGDGVTNDRVALQAAIDYVAARGGGTVDLEEKDYLTDQTVTLTSKLRLQNGTIRGPNIPLYGTVLGCYGSSGSPQTLTADRSRGSYTLPVLSAAGISVGQWVFVTSNRVWALQEIGGSPVKCGELVKVIAKTGNTLTLREATSHEYTMADGTTVTPLTWADDIVLDNITIRGGGNGTIAGAKNQYGIRFWIAANVELRHVDIRYCDYACVEFGRSMNTTVIGGFFGEAYDNVNGGIDDGLSYGIAWIDGCQDGQAIGAVAHNTRHGFAIGGSEGVNRRLTWTGCKSLESRAGGFDAHVAADDCVWDGCISTQRLGDLSAGSQNGFQWAGGSVTVTNCRSLGAWQYGFAFQTLVQDKTVTLDIRGNRAIADGGNTSTSHAAFWIEASAATGIASLTFSDNTTQGAEGRLWNVGLFMWARNGDIQNIAISNNTFGVVQRRCVDVRADAGRVIRRWSVVGNNGYTTTTVGNYGLYFEAATADYITNGTVVGNTFYGGETTARGINNNRVLITGNVFTDGTAAISWPGATIPAGSNITA